MLAYIPQIIFGTAWTIADGALTKSQLRQAPINVRFRGQSGHEELEPRCPLLTKADIGLAKFA